MSHYCSNARKFNKFKITFGTPTAVIHCFKHNFTTVLAFIGENFSILRCLNESLMCTGIFIHSVAPKLHFLKYMNCCTCSSSTKVMGQGDLSIFYSSFSSSSGELFENFDNLSDASRANWMTFGFQSP